MKHKSVLLKESIDNLNIKVDGVYVDATLGFGGHSLEILKRINKGFLFAFDQDSEAIGYSQERLKDYSKYPGMKVFQFAFGEANSPFLPENYIENCVAYTGTHDNDTFPSFLQDDNNKKLVCEYLNISTDTEVKYIIKQSIVKLYHSRADVVIINPQDILNQGNDFRFNTPGTTDKNWSYCANNKLYNKENVDFLLANSNSSNRRG